MRYFILISLFLSLTALQPDEGRLVKAIPFPTAKSMTLDPIGNLYVIADNQLLKFDGNGKPLQNFSDYRLGELRSADAGNAMKVLLFYPDMARIIVLGTQFAPQSTIELRNIGIIQPTLVCNSINNGYWIFDLQDFQLKKIDLNLQPVFTSGNLTQLTGNRVLPNYMTEYDHRVYLNNPETGILVFDQFGAYLKTLPIKGLKGFQLFGNEVFFLQEGRLKAMDLRLLNEREISLPDQQELRAVNLNDQRYYLLTNDSLNIYSY